MTNKPNHITRLGILIALLLAAALSACGGPPEPPAEPAQPGESGEPAEPAEPAQPTEEPAPEDTGDTSSEVSQTGGMTVFQIVQTESEARFSVGEVLLGSPNTVIGITSQVTGEITVDFNDPASAQVGTIQIDASTLVTDNDRRNRALNNRILDTNQYPFIQFAPTAITGLPGSITIGEAVAFQITGDLTIKDTTHSVVFDMTVTPASETRLEGAGTTTVAYADYGIGIPSVPNVASVDEEVILEIEFVATP